MRDQMRDDKQISHGQVRIRAVNAIACPHHKHLAAMSAVWLA